MVFSLGRWSCVGVSGFPEKGKPEGVRPTRSVFPGFFLKPFHRRLLVLFDGDFHRALGAFEQVFGLFAEVEGFGDLFIESRFGFLREEGEIVCFHDVSTDYDFPVGAAREPPCRRVASP